MRRVMRREEMTGVGSVMEMEGDDEENSMMINWRRIDIVDDLVGGVIKSVLLDLMMMEVLSLLHRSPVPVVMDAGILLVVLLVGKEDIPLQISKLVFPKCLY
jgi:hypothetical protein